MANALSVVYSKKLNAKFYKSTVLAAICNTNWEGEIQSEGSKVVIRTRPDITIGDYDRATGVVYQDLEPATTELPIDKTKYYGFIDDYIQTAQADIALVNESAADAAEGMKIAVDGDVLGNIYTDVHADNKIDGGGTGVVVDKTNVLDYIVDMGTLLDEKNVPESGRWLVLPPWMCGMIKKSELKDASLAGDGTSIMRNGRLGMIDRFTLYCSNNLAVATGVTQCMAGTKDFTGFASQFIKHESLTLEKHFGIGHRGLQVYGYKVLKPEAGVLLAAKKS
ncbi:hypothetical protein [Endozoicomonas atrinae]|uniref:hypothetical protein n=1 Tax=Endozoicomonas atrinae TaxID=1333660 RepID=UPI000824B203|nr:hypothetical protein [Endozoicomonas atrinae]